ncbi:hypothetical protein ACXR2T_07805 [Leucobacter sp. HY1910]
MNHLTEARLAAYQARGQQIIAVAEQRLTPQDVIAAAAEREVLRPITLKRLLGAQPGWGDAKVGRFTAELARICGTEVKPHRLTIGWLIDRRAGGRRLIAYANLWRQEQRAQRPLPWPGFPYTPAPTGELS